MAKQTWRQTLYTMPFDATAVTTTGEQLMVPNVTLPANYVDSGTTLSIKMFGKISNIVTTPGTVTFRARWGGLTGTVLATSAALTQNTVAQTDDALLLEFLIVARLGMSTGSTMWTNGNGIQGNAPSAPSPFLIPAASNALVTGLDVTIAQALSFTAQFSLTGNSLTINQYILESLAN